MNKQIWPAVALLICGACSPDESTKSGVNGGAGANPVASGGSSGAPANAGSGVSTNGLGGTGAAGTPAGSAGRSSTAGSGPSAGPVAAGAGGQPGAGTGAAGAAGAPAAAMGGSNGAAGTPASGSTAGTVTVQFTTVSYGGEYAPLNYGAVWFEDASGKFIKTTTRWAGAAHATDLVAWTKASGGWGSFFGGGNTADMMDAMSSATIRTHQAHTVMWNMMNAQKQLVPDGEYVARIEMSESRALIQAGPVLEIKFTKGPMPQTVEVPNMESFTGIMLRYMPQ